MPECPNCAEMRTSLYLAEQANERLRAALRWTVNAMCNCSKADGGEVYLSEYKAAIEAGIAALEAE